MAPPVIPPDIYPGLIKTYELANSQNGNPMLRFQVALMDWPPSVAKKDRVQEGPNGEEVPIDLSKKQMRKDFFLTSNAYYRLENFLEAMGFDVETDAAGNKDYETPVSQLIGAKVDVEVQKILSNRTQEFINVCGELLPPKANGKSK
jgi:hypothetical protein